MASADFWSNRERAQGEVEEVSRLKSLINPMMELDRALDDFIALEELTAEESDAATRASAEKELALEHARLVRRLEEFELRQFLSGENDRSNAFVTIHSGAGSHRSALIVASPPSTVRRSSTRPLRYHLSCYGQCCSAPVCLP